MMFNNYSIYLQDIAKNDYLTINLKADELSMLDWTIIYLSMFKTALLSKIKLFN